MRSLLAEPIPARALDQAAFSRSGQAWGCPPVSLPVVRDQRRTAGVTEPNERTVTAGETATDKRSWRFSSDVRLDVLLDFHDRRSSQAGNLLRELEDVQ